MILHNNPIEQKILEQIYHACDNNDLTTIKSLMPQIEINSIYHIGICNSKDIFTRACLSGHLDIVKELLYLTVNHFHDKTIFNSAFTILLQKNKVETYPVITYLMNEPALENVCYPSEAPYSGLPSILFPSCHDAIKANDIQLLEVLLNLEGNKNNKWILKDIGTIFSMLENQEGSKVLKYILTHPQLKDEIEHLPILILASQKNHLNILEYLIFDYKIEKTEQVESYIANNLDTIRMFELRDLNRNLHDDLQYNNQMIRKNKV